MLGLTQLADGQQTEALESARKAVAVAESLFARERTPANGDALVAALNVIGTLAPDRETKLSAFRRVSSVAQALLAECADDQRAQWLLIIIGSHISLGVSEFGNGRFREAIAALLEAHGWGNKLLPVIGPKAWGCFDLADTEYQLCRAYREDHQFDDAIGAGRRAIAIYQTLFMEYPKDLRPATGLELAEQEVARAHLAAGRPAEAIAAFEQARRTLEGIVARPDLQPSWVTHSNLALADLDHHLLAASDSDPVRFAELRRAVTIQLFEICDKVSLIQPLPQYFRGLHAGACLHVALYREEETGQADLDLLRKSERLWAEIHHEEPQGPEARRNLVIVRQQLAEALAARGLDEEASRWRRDSLSTARGRPGLFYEIALEYARYALEARGSLHQHASTRTEAQLRRLQRYAASMIREAIADGFLDVRRLRHESLLAPILSLPEFQTLIGDEDFPVDPFARP